MTNRLKYLKSLLRGRVLTHRSEFDRLALNYTGSTRLGHEHVTATCASRPVDSPALRTITGWISLRGGRCASTLCRRGRAWRRRGLRRRGRERAARGRAARGRAAPGRAARAASSRGWRAGWAASERLGPRAAPPAPAARGCPPPAGPRWCGTRPPTHTENKLNLKTIYWGRNAQYWCRLHSMI